MVDKQIEKCAMSIKLLMGFVVLMGSGFAATTTFAKFVVKYFGENILRFIVVVESSFMFISVMLIMLNFFTIRKLNIKKREGNNV